MLYSELNPALPPVGHSSFEDVWAFIASHSTLFHHCSSITLRLTTDIDLKPIPAFTSLSAVSMDVSNGGELFSALSKLSKPPSHVSICSPRLFATVTADTFAPFSSTLTYLEFRNPSNLQLIPEGLLEGIAKHLSPVLRQLKLPAARWSQLRNMEVLTHLSVACTIAAKMEYTAKPIGEQLDMNPIHVGLNLTFLQPKPWPPKVTYIDATNEPDQLSQMLQVGLNLNHSTDGASLFDLYCLSNPANPLEHLMKVLIEEGNIDWLGLATLPKVRALRENYPFVVSRLVLFLSRFGYCDIAHWALDGPLLKLMTSHSRQQLFYPAHPGVLPLSHVLYAIAPSTQDFNLVFLDLVLARPDLFGEHSWNDVDECGRTLLHLQSTEAFGSHSAGRLHNRQFLLVQVDPTIRDKFGRTAQQHHRALLHDDSCFSRDLPSVAYWASPQLNAPDNFQEALQGWIKEGPDLLSREVTLPLLISFVHIGLREHERSRLESLRILLQLSGPLLPMALEAVLYPHSKLLEFYHTHFTAPASRLPLLAQPFPHVLAKSIVDAQVSIPKHLATCRQILQVVKSSMSQSSWAAWIGQVDTRKRRWVGYLFDYKHDLDLILLEQLQVLLAV